MHCQVIAWLHFQRKETAWRINPRPTSIPCRTQASFPVARLLPRLKPARQRSGAGRNLEGCQSRIAWAKGLPAGVWAKYAPHCPSWQRKRGRSWKTKKATRRQPKIRTAIITTTPPTLNACACWQRLRRDTPSPPSKPGAIWIF